MGMHLGIDFSWIFFDSGRQVGAKLPSKIDKKSIQKSIKNMIRKKGIWTRLGGVLETLRAVFVGGTEGRGMVTHRIVDPPKALKSKKSLKH